MKNLYVLASQILSRISFRPACSPPKHLGPTPSKQDFLGRHSHDHVFDHLCDECRCRTIALDKKLGWTNGMYDGCCLTCFQNALEEVNGHSLPNRDTKGIFPNRIEIRDTGIELHFDGKVRFLS